ncbi:uncharacterized protein LOC121988709 [Zingiber officinale]|uniref:uncharacterized protein LOC121988709 n=1 Tax=Zingiber officinale TaxID=94328 RepID=UPI001C4D7CF2|nr:uncharacterized protein LOC121988709 [Zingiber officinale]
MHPDYHHTIVPSCNEAINMFMNCEPKSKEKNSKDDSSHYIYQAMHSKAEDSRGSGEDAASDAGLRQGPCSLGESEGGCGRHPSQDESDGERLPQWDAAAHLHLLFAGR